MYKRFKLILLQQVTMSVYVTDSCNGRPAKGIHVGLKRKGEKQNLAEG